MLVKGDPGVNTVFKIWSSKFQRGKQKNARCDLLVVI